MNHLTIRNLEVRRVDNDGATIAVHEIDPSLGGSSPGYRIELNRLELGLLADALDAMADRNARVKR